MQFDVAALRQAVWAQVSPHLTTIGTAAGGTLAILVALGGVWLFWPEPEITEEASVAVAGPAFTPAIIAAPAPAPAAKPAERTERPVTSYDDLRREDDRSLARAVQRELQRAGCYDGPINGYWSPSTRKAMSQFTGLVNARLPVDHPDPILLVLLETHDKVTCGPDGEDHTAPPSRKGETASLADDRSSDGREAARYDVPKAPEPELPGRVAAAEPESEAAHPAAAAAVAGGAAALTTAAVAPGEKSALGEPTPEEPRKVVRKRKPSLARQVSRGFKKIQRSLNKIFW